MITIVIQIAVVVLLTLLNGLFAMSETALVSSRRTRLKQRAEDGDRGRRPPSRCPTSQPVFSRRCRSGSR